LTWVWDRPHDAAGTETVVTVTLDDRCGKTRMTFRQTGFKSAESRDGHESGWTQAFERLRDLVEIADGPPAPGETTGPEGDVEFVLRRVFDAPRPLVYRAWTDPTMVVRWWGPHHFTNPVCELDVRPGGKLRIVMRGPDGRDYPFKGVFTEVVEQERLVYTNDTSGHPPEWHAAVNPNGAAATPEPDPTTTVTFEDLGDKTAVTVRMTFASPAQREGYLRVRMSDGWSQSMERLKAALSEA
jgi:uncharacterized protein YndB with AHSA1/START domain